MRTRFGRTRKQTEAGPACPYPRRRRIFWRVYGHGMFLLVAVTLTAALIHMPFRPATPSSELPESLCSYLEQSYLEAGRSAQVLQVELERLDRLARLQVSVFDLEGRLLASNVDPPLEVPDGAFRAQGRRYRSIHGPGWAFEMTLREADRAFAVMHVQLPFSPRGTWMRPILFLLAILLVLALASIPLVRGILRPLEHLTRTTIAFGEGDLSARTRIQGNDETALLAQAFDQMADRIEALIRSEKELMANVSHELRTPLARIRVALELAGEGDAEEAKRYVLELREDLEELEHLVEDVLTAARLDLAQSRAGDGMPLKLEPVSGDELIDRVMERFVNAHPERELVLERPHPLPRITADPVLLRRVLDNLLDNARKYSAPDAPIVLATRQEPGMIILEVRDAGQGIVAEDLPRLFTPFFRADRSRQRGSGGVGLGLTLVKRVVEAHGGTVEATSEEGRGSIFRVRLPLPSAEAKV